MNLKDKFTEEGDAAVALPVIREWRDILSTPEVLLLFSSLLPPIFAHANSVGTPLKRFTGTSVWLSLQMASISILDYSANDSQSRKPDVHLLRSKATIAAMYMHCS